MQTLTFEQAANLLTAATMRDTISCRGGVVLIGHLHDQYREQLNEVEANIPADLARAARTATAARDPKTTLAAATFAWLRDQNVTD